MKFDDYKNIIKTPHGTEYVTKNVMICDDERPCHICGCSSKYVEINSEALLCSDECVGIFYKRLDDILRNIDDRSDGDGINI